MYRYRQLMGASGIYYLVSADDTYCVLWHILYGKTKSNQHHITIIIINTKFEDITTYIDTLF